MNSKWKLTVVVVLLIVLGANIFLKNTQHKDTIRDDNKQEDLLPEKPMKTIESYFPVAPNTVWEYEVKNKYQETYSASIDYIKNNTVQMRYKGKKGTTIKVYIQEEEGLYEVATVEDSFIKNDYTLLRQYKHLVLKLPLQVGNSWVIQDKGIRTITAVDQSMDTALGPLKVIEVETRHEDYVTRQYFSEKIGLVGWYEETKDYNQYVNIESYTTNKPFKIKVNGYYANEKTEELEMHRQTIQVMTNEETKHFMTDILKNTPDEEYIQALPIDVDIQNIFLVEETDTVVVDLSGDYNPQDYTLLEEKLATKSLVDTIGEYYRVKQVSITVNGGAYKGPIEVGE